jgi:hypothetical protein
LIGGLFQSFELADSLKSLRYREVVVVSNKTVHQRLGHLITDFPTPMLNTFNAFPVFEQDQVPSQEHLEQGAQLAFNWLSSTFNQACRQIVDTGKTEVPFMIPNFWFSPLRSFCLRHCEQIFFTAPEFSDFISPELAACLDVQLAHFVSSGFVPLSEITFNSASLDACRWLSPVPPSYFPEHDPDHHTALALMLEVSRGRLRMEYGAKPIWLNRFEWFRDLLKPRSSRMEVFFEIAFTDKRQWYSLSEKRALSAMEALSNNLVSLARVNAADPKPGVVSIAEDCVMLLSLSAPTSEMPLRFKIHNMNEVTWVL